MTGVNKTLYIPLYGKAAVSKKGVILKDVKAEEIWEKEGFELHGKAKSKWLTYYMAMRARVFDDWTREQLKVHPGAVVLHIGCGMDGRIERLGRPLNQWYDLDFPEVIGERKKYYAESESYHMLTADASEPGWLKDFPKDKPAVVIMEGVSMYLENEPLKKLLSALGEQFSSVSLLMDVYTVFGAKASKYKNPINEVGVRTLFGIDKPESLENEKVRFIGEKDMTPAALIDELKGFEHGFFKLMFGGKAAKKIYRLFEYGAQ